MKNNMIKKTVSVAIATALVSSVVLPTFAAASEVNDFRVTDQYTALTYGSTNNEVLQYTGSDSGVVLTGDGASINTTGAFSIVTREDILDSVAKCENIEFAMTVNASSCDSFVISATDGQTTAELYNSTPSVGENAFSIKYSDGSATLLLNGQTVNSATLSSVPQITISGSNAVMEISGVSYGEAAIPETEEQAQIRDAINTATDSETMETALMAYLGAEGKDSTYSSLPDCDRIEIKDRMLESIPFENRAELVNGYQKSLEYTTQVDLDEYNNVFTEDFSNFDAGWTKTNVVDGAIGNAKKTVDRQALKITDENYSFLVFGGSLNAKAANYIERTVANPKSVVTMYIKVANNNALSFSALFDQSQGIQLKNTGARLNTTVGGDTKVDISTTSWNKIVFDGTEDGKVKCYVNGALAATFSGSITKLNVGTLFNFSSFSAIAIDNISIAEPKTAEEHLAVFNEVEVTAKSLTDMLGRAEVSAEVLNVLPECDVTEIVSRMEKERPFADVNTFKNAYRKALEYITQVDLDKYNKVFKEDFSSFDAGWTKTNVIDGAIGNGKANGTARQSLAIDDENSSFMFFGGSLNPKNANYIEREVTNPNSIVTMYMKVLNNNALSFSATFDGEQGICLKNTGVSVHTLPNSTIKDTGVDFVADKWNKIVFDAMEDGKVKCYVNGALAATFNGSITKLNVGTIFNFGSYSVIAVDNITIAEEKTAEQYLAMFNETEVTLAGLMDMFDKAEVSAEVLNVLPECDVTEIVSRMEKERPFADVNTFKSAYRKALEYTTQVDLDLYNKAFKEDFSSFDSGWTKTNVIDGAIGNGKANGTARQSLVIDDENSSFMFFGGALNPKNANYIEREVTNPNSIVTMYMKVLNNNALSFSATFDGEQGICLKNTGTSVHTLPNSTIKDTGVDFVVDKWNKIVFDGMEDGTVKCYVNGNLTAAYTGSITKLSVGTIFNFGSYSVIAVDNITVSESNKVQAVKVLNKGIEIADNKLPEAETVTVKIENPQFDTDYIVAVYNNEKRFVKAYVLTKEEQRNGKVSEDIVVSDATEMKIFAWDDVATLKPLEGVICLTK